MKFRPFAAIFFSLVVSFYVHAATPLTLHDAVHHALMNSKLQKISEYDLTIAKARYDQALSASYPIVDVMAVANRSDDLFIDRTNDTIDAPIVGSLKLDYDHVIMGENTAFAKIDINYPLYTGGKINAIQKQAGLGVAISKESAAQTHDEIEYTVTTYYTGAVLAHNIVMLAEETLGRMKAILDLTEAMYTGGSLSVKKTDYLRTKITYGSIESMLEEMKAKEELAKSALLFAMGEKSDNDIILADTALEIPTLQNNFQGYLNALYETNHQWAKTKIALDIYDAKIDEAQSEYLPTIALYANAKRLYNNYDGGIINPTNENTLNAGVAMQYNLYHGGLSDARVAEAQLEKLKLLTQKAYLDDALNLQLKQAYLEAQRSLKQVRILEATQETAQENRDLNFRAYQEDLVETKDVIESQIFESLTKASYLRACHDVIINEANLRYIIGKN